MKLHRKVLFLNGLEGGNTMSQFLPEALSALGSLSSLFGGGDKMPSYDKMLKMLQGMYGQGRKDISGGLERGLGFEAPYMAAGQEGLETYLGSMGLGGEAARQKAFETFKEAPGYQYKLDQGLSAVQKGMGASGLAGSGAEEKALQQTGQGLANQEFSNFQNRLAALASGGQQVAETGAGQTLGAGEALGNLGLGYGRTMANMWGSGKSAQASELPSRLSAESGIGQFMQPYMKDIFSKIGSWF